MHTRLSVTCLLASLLVGLSPNALAIPTKPGKVSSPSLMINMGRVGKIFTEECYGSILIVQHNELVRLDSLGNGRCA